MLSTHVLDTALGRPGAGIAITLWGIQENVRTHLADAVTNSDGRTDAPIAASLVAGLYVLEFHVAAYFERGGSAAFYDVIAIRFHIAEAGGKYHVPLILSPWGYSTYRGS